jgi:type I restriction enzyme S subunit
MQTQTVDYKYMNFVNLINFDLWDTKRYTSINISSKYNIVELSTCIKEESKKYKLSEEKEKEFGILGVNNKIGIFDAYTQKGKDINQAYKKMEVGWIAYNPYRINVGSIGIRLEEHKNEYISPAYVVFSCLNNLLPDYLFLLFKTDRFNKVINESTTGSVRQNLTFDTLKKLQIPLPTIEEQTEIINAYQNKIQQAKKLEQNAIELRLKIEKHLFEALDINKTIKRKLTKTLSLIEFNNIDKWGVEYNLGSNSDLILNSNKYKNDRLKNLLDINPKTILPKDNIDISFIPMESVSDEYGEISELKSKKIIESKGYTKFQEGDLIWARITPCMQNGKSAIVNNLVNSLGCGSTEFHVIRNKNNNVDLNYVYHILRLPLVLNNAMSHFTGSAGQQRVPKTFLEELLIPVPPIEIQKKIANELSNIKQEIKITDLKNLQFINKAKLELEETIFN